ncbi:hypothetical protein ABPG74_007972 [Tetrahymena malaccensis]
MKSNSLVILLTAVALLSTASYLVFQQKSASDLSDIRDILPPLTNIQTIIRDNKPAFLIQYTGAGKMAYKILYQSGDQNLIQNTYCLATDSTDLLKVTSINQILAIETVYCPYIPPCPHCGTYTSNDSTN